MDSKKPSYKKVAENLALFITKNWHFCPIDSDIPVKECEGWGYYPNLCSECLMNHSSDIKPKSRF